MKFKQLGWIVLAGLVGLSIVSTLFASGVPATPLNVPTTPTLEGTPFPDLVLTLTADRLLPPRMSSPPTQADRGAEYYWFVCLPCHGDKGQGLTDEWRAVYGPEEMNCWQSKCHGKRHPAEGFELPRSVPPVLGPNSLGRFSNAAELHRIIGEAMPWYRPDYMTEEQSWDVTAFLLREHGVMPPGGTLNAGNAPIFQLRTPAPVQDEERPLTVAVIGLLFLATGVVIWHYGRQAA